MRWFRVRKLRNYWPGDPAASAAKHKGRHSPLCTVPPQLHFAFKLKQTYFFFGGMIASFAAFDRRNFTTLRAGIVYDCPFFSPKGIMPVRAAFSCMTNLPRPGKVNWFFASLYASSA